jgi:hypothetical protein
MIDYRTEKHLPNHIEGKGFIVLEDGFDKGPSYNSNVMLHKVIVFTTKKAYLISRGKLGSTKDHQSYLGKKIDGKCYVNLGTGTINITNQSMPIRFYKDWKGKDTQYKPTRWERTFYKYGKRIMEITQEELNSIVVETLL